MTEQSTKPSWVQLRRYYARFRQYLRPDTRYFALDVASIIVAVATNTAMIWLMGQPLSLIQAGDYDGLTTVLVVFAGVLLLNQAMQMGGGWLTGWLMLRFIGRARNAIVSRLLNLSFPVAGRVARGDLLARLSNDVDRISHIVVEARLMLVSHLLTLSLYTFMLFWIDVRLALIALAAVPLFVLHQRFFSERKRRATEGFLEANGKLLSFEEQALANLRGVSANTAEPQVTAMHQQVFARACRWAVRERGLEVAFMTSFTVLIYLVGLLVVVLGVDDVRNGAMPVGLLVSFLLYLGYLAMPVRGLVDIAFQYMGNAPAALRVLEVLDAQPQVVDADNAPELRVSEGQIAIEDVSFAYPGGAMVLRHAQVTIHGGETVALVGPSGSGKSTLAALLLRFYDPQEGRICIDGQDLREVSLASLRRNMAVVWQEPFVLNDTLRANLLLARPEASEEQLVTACQRSHAWEFISALPGGLDTELGAGGVELSGGQKQRLAIAQAFLRDAPMLILDEASSALDSQSEQVIVQALDALRAQRTTLLIAHRFSSIRNAHRVIYFETDGSLSVGSHDELFEAHPAYREAVEWQTAGQGDEGDKASKAGR
ncbi:MAG TPA: ABC transporter ATP-binding protein [Gammaproteobacteria bacterium]|nr:ABC transporter ATP-binding protein [Gammaproteobacteria bacterium]